MQSRLRKCVVANIRYQADVPATVAIRDADVDDDDDGGDDGVDDDDDVDDDVDKAVV